MIGKMDKIELSVDELINRYKELSGKKNICRCKIGYYKKYVEGVDGLSIVLIKKKATE